jgi:hypothetical protein
MPGYLNLSWKGMFPIMLKPNRRNDSHAATQFRRRLGTRIATSVHEQTDCEVAMKKSGKQPHSKQRPGPSAPPAQPPKPSQAEGERQEPQTGEQPSVANPQVQAETPPKPSQAEGEPDTAK